MSFVPITKFALPQNSKNKNVFEKSLNGIGFTFDFLMIFIPKIYVDDEWIEIQLQIFCSRKKRFNWFALTTEIVLFLPSTVYSVGKTLETSIIEINPNWPGVFANFLQKFCKIFSLISPQLRVPEKRTIARLKGLVLGFHFNQLSPSRRAPSPSEFVFFLVPRGLVVTTEYYWDLLREKLLCKCMGLVFAMDQDSLRKVDFANLLVRRGICIVMKNGNFDKNNFWCTTHFSQFWRHIHFS